MAPFTFRKHHGSAKPTLTSEQSQAAVAAQAPILPSVDELAELQPEESEETVSAPVELEDNEEAIVSPAPIAPKPAPGAKEKKAGKAK